jgi:hypothetical protein
MDIFDEDIINFWKSLNANYVSYIMVGGFAVNMHGYLRSTGDIDIWIKDSFENRENLGRAMEMYGYKELSWKDIQFLPGWTNFYIGSGIVLDIMIEMKGLEGFSFDESLKLATIATINDIQVPFLHINQLIANKKAVNRSKDQLDVIELEKIKLLRKEMGLD